MPSFLSTYYVGRLWRSDCCFSNLFYILVLDKTRFCKYKELALTVQKSSKVI